MDATRLNMNRLGEVKDKVRKRVLTDARKEQNRVAQRAYRQRQKEASRNSKVGPSTTKDHRRRQPHVRADGGAAAPTQLLGETTNDNPEPIGVVEELEFVRSGQNLQDTGFESTQIEPPPTSTSAISQQEPVVHNTDAGFSTLSSFEQRTTAGPAFALAQPYFLEELSTANSSNSSGPKSWVSLQDLGSSPEDLERIWPLDTQSFQAFYPYQSGNSQVTDLEKAHVNTSLASDPISQLRPHEEDAEEDITIFPNHADPLANILQMHQTPVFYATLHNAHVLGITISQLLTARHLSPFYRPTTPADDPRALVAAAHNPSFPAHLQPTLAQIMFPHHAYLDLLPFPIFRTRAIAMSVAKPRLFDHTELKRDIVVNGGFSWDMQVWQIAPWFFNKWKMLLVREDSDIWM